MKTRWWRKINDDEEEKKKNMKIFIDTIKKKTVIKYDKKTALAYD